MDDLGRVAEALISYRLLSPEMTRRVLSGVIDADYGGRDGYGGNTDSDGTQTIATHVRDLIAASLRR